MATKIVQVPMDAALLEQLDVLSRQERRSRSALIRDACRQYLKVVAVADLEHQYEEGYRREPEDAALAEAQASLAGDALPAESW